MFRLQEEHMFTTGGKKVAKVILEFDVQDYLKGFNWAFNFQGVELEVFKKCTSL